MGKPAGDGKADGSSLTIDGGYRNEHTIEARAPLIALNGQRSKLVMYDGVTLQNNYNYSDTDGTHLYGNGAGVYIRTDDGSPDNQAEFIMRGGAIRGNINNTQNNISCGGGVSIFAFGLFTMEGGEILDNIVYRSGGGFHTGGRGSFKKTGGVIYGADAGEALRNTVIDGTTVPVVYGHAVCVAIVEDPLYQLRDDTVGADDPLSYTGTPIGDGVFGEGENWGRPGDDRRQFLLSGGILVLIIGGISVFCFIRIRRKKQAAMAARHRASLVFEEIKQNLSPREKEVFELLLTDRSLKMIADELNISYSGVNSHTKKIYRKFGVQSRTELMVAHDKSRFPAAED
jgi:DNA-binding CsgD family transcriptional regulator